MLQYDFVYKKKKKRVQYFGQLEFRTAFHLNLNGFTYKLWSGLLCPAGKLSSGLLCPAGKSSKGLRLKLLTTELLLLLLLLSHVSRVWLCATPWTAAHQAPPSLRFSRQEHWSGWPFPSPMHESEKWSRLVVSDLQPPMLLCPWDFPGKSSGVGCHCPLLHETSRNLLENCVLDCMPSAIRTADSERDCSKETKGKGQHRCYFGEGRMHATKHRFFQKLSASFVKFLLVMRNSHHHEGF